MPAAEHCGELLSCWCLMRSCAAFQFSPYDGCTTQPLHWSCHASAACAHKRTSCLLCLDVRNWHQPTDAVTLQHIRERLTRHVNVLDQGHGLSINSHSLTSPCRHVQQQAEPQVPLACSADQHVLHLHDTYPKICSTTNNQQAHCHILHFLLQRSFLIWAIVTNTCRRHEAQIAGTAPAMSSACRWRLASKSALLKHNAYTVYSGQSHSNVHISYISQSEHQ